MHKYKKIQQTIVVHDGFVCDKCKTEFPSTDIIETQECVTVAINGGYGSVFGDMCALEAVFCQGCAKELFGEYLVDLEESDEDIS